MMYKYIVKNVAHRHGKVATFMPKPLFGDNGSGMHTHMSFWKGGKNLFAGSGYAGLSETALFAMGGVLKHARALIGLTNPTTNSYKRLTPGYEAPINLALQRAKPLGLSAHSDVQQQPEGEALRVPLSGPELQSVPRVLSDHDGRNRRHPEQDSPWPAARQGLYDSSAGRVGEGPQHAGSLDESLDALEEDHEFLLKGEVFTARRDRNVDRLQAQEGSRPSPPAPASPRILPVLRHVIKSRGREPVLPCDTSGGRKGRQFYFMGYS